MHIASFEVNGSEPPSLLNIKYLFSMLIVTKLINATKAI